MTRMTLQYFFILFKSSSITCMPRLSCHFLTLLVKAFFLDLYLNGERDATHQGEYNQSGVAITRVG